MNEKITLPTLVSLLADKTGKQKKQCEDFLREFFNTLVDAMEAGENVRIKSLGTFKVVAVEPRKSVNVNTGEQMEIPGHNKIVFVPAKELAEEVNAPFAMFESIEIPDNALEDPLLSSESVSAAQAEEDPLPSDVFSPLDEPATLRLAVTKLRQSINWELCDISELPQNLLTADSRDFSCTRNK